MPRAVALLVLAMLLAGCLGAGVDPALTDAAPDPGAPIVVPEAPTFLANNPWRDREADVAIDPRDPDHVAVLYNERPKGYLTGAILTDPLTPGILRQALAVSHDGGETWTRQVVPQFLTAPSPTSRWNLWCMMGDPITFFDSDSVLHIVTLAVSCGGPGLTGVEGILHATTSDDGATWSEPDIAWVGAGGLAVVFHDREWAAIDPATGRIGIAWTAFYLSTNRVDLMAVFSEDGGRTWGVPDVVRQGLPVEQIHNYLLHATWAADGRFHISGVDCPGLVLGDSPPCLGHYRGAPGGPWERSELPLAACGPLPPGAGPGYAVSVADHERARLYVGLMIESPDGVPLDGCLAASDDHGATWGTVTRLGNGTGHAWLGLAPDGHLAVAHLRLVPDGAEPALALLDPVTLAVRSTTALGPVYAADTDGDGVPEYGDYDAMASSGGRFLWALTVPNDRGEVAPEGWAELDVRAYRGTFMTA